MTPAINLLKKKRIFHAVHQYQHDPANTDFGNEAVTALGQDPAQVFKTLLFCKHDDAKALCVAVVPVAGKLDLKAAAKAAGYKKAEMADPVMAEKITGYIVGGISPLGQKKALPTFIDNSAQQFDTVCVSAGRRGLEIELAPQDLSTLTRGQFVPLGK
ncbi:Cys-tRNA(Pro) deacylase [Thaumasiovibrio sp. DFM-14]|uniref:Cys-tRNA(Pro) deacylase n=1 Tax=Thaumasiovibrio sp. DFM-14 TaxID=3384792 RepID=UPI0039A3F587